MWFFPPPYYPEVVHLSSPQNLILICQLYYWQKKTVNLNGILIKSFSPDVPSDHQRHLAKRLNLNDWSLWVGPKILLFEGSVVLSTIRLQLLKVVNVLCTTWLNKNTLCYHQHFQCIGKCKTEKNEWWLESSFYKLESERNRGSVA